MKTGKITAKLRDAVPVVFIVEGNEVIRYKNIELPDDLKELEMKDYHFDCPEDGKITFHLIFDNGVLPETFPSARPAMTRAAKAAAKAEAAANEEPKQPGHEEYSEPATDENAPENPGQPSDIVADYLPETAPETAPIDETPATDEPAPETPAAPAKSGKRGKKPGNK